MSLPGTRERVAILAIGLLGNSLIVNAFDYVLYPWVIWQLGLLHGAIAMTMASFLICYATLLFYDWAKKDWLGIETIKELRENDRDNHFTRVLKWAMQKGEAALLFVLSIWTDPFVTVAYMRHGAHQYNGMSGRDWRIFMLSLAIGNLYWSVLLFTGISAAEHAWIAITGT